MKEIWKPVVGYEGIYEVSSWGNVRTAVGKTTYSTRHGCDRVWKQRTLKQKTYNGRGRKDLKVTLYKDGKKKTWLVARLVGTAFVECDNPNALTINHIDGNSLNNRADNLEWLPLSDNIKVGFETGCYDSIQKRVSIKKRGTEEKKEFRSMSQASNYLGHHKNYLSLTLRKGRTATDTFGNCYEVEVLV